MLLEAHLFDFDGDLYGRELEVEFVARLRDEANFASLGALIGMVMAATQSGRIAGLGNPLASGPTDVSPGTGPASAPAGWVGTYRPNTNAIWARRFGSWHPGVCQFVFCDGSVRAIKNTIDEINLGRLAVRNDSQVITADY